MALGLGEGGEQNAPLGRAVIGGLMFATVATLMFVPVVFSLCPQAPARTTSAAFGGRLMAAPPGRQRVSCASSASRASPPRRSSLFLVVTGIGEREVGGARLREWTEAQAIPTVALVALNPQPGVVSLDLPGRLEAATRAPIYARVSGYVKTRSVDIGDIVKAGRDARRDRGARSRPTADAGQSRSHQRRGERAAFAGDARPRTQPLDLQRRLAAGPRPALRRPRRQAGGRARGQANVERLQSMAGTSGSPRRSTASSPRATPTSAP